jgi:hypothetical protein
MHRTLDVVQEWLTRIVKANCLHLDASTKTGLCKLANKLRWTAKRWRESGE